MKWGGGEESREWTVDVSMQVSRENTREVIASANAPKWLLRVSEDQEGGAHS